MKPHRLFRLRYQTGDGEQHVVWFRAVRPARAAYAAVESCRDADLCRVSFSVHPVDGMLALLNSAPWMTPPGDVIEILSVPLQQQRRAP